MSDNPQIPSSLTDEQMNAIRRRVDFLRCVDDPESEIMSDMLQEIEFLGGIINDLILDGAEERWKAGYDRGYKDGVEAGKLQIEEKTHSHVIDVINQELPSTIDWSGLAHSLMPIVRDIIRGTQSNE